MVVPSLECLLSFTRLLLYLSIKITIYGYKILDESKPHFVTFTVVNWGGPTIRDVFSRSKYRDKVIESFEYC